MRKLLVSAAVAASFALVGVAPAAAGPTKTPNGLCGAKNMVNENSRDAMVTAMMEHTNIHGDIGMGRAVTNSACES